MSDLPTLRLTTRHILPSAPDPDAEAARARGGYPWCDTCQSPSFGGAGIGLVHKTDRSPGWVPREWSDHEVTHMQWYGTPTCVDDPFFAARGDL